MSSCSSDGGTILGGEAPEALDNVDEASDVVNSKANVSRMGVPSRGSAMSLVSAFGVRNGHMDWSNEAFHLGAGRFLR